MMVTFTALKHLRPNLCCQISHTYCDWNSGSQSLVVDLNEQTAHINTSDDEGRNPDPAMKVLATMLVILGLYFHGFEMNRTSSLYPLRPSRMKFSAMLAWTQTSKHSLVYQWLSSSERIQSNFLFGPCTRMGSSNTFRNIQTGKWLYESCAQASRDSLEASKGIVPKLLQMDDLSFAWTWR